MIVTIHQPDHLPYLGVLDKINKSDIYVILDDVDFKKHNFQNRNKIATKYGPKWLTVPVKHVKKHINEQEVVDHWKQRYRNKVVEAYRKHLYFKQGLDLIDEMLSQDSNLLIDYNMCYFKKIITLLDIKTEIVTSSSLGVTSKKSQKLYDICERLNATHYLAGSNANSYIDRSLFDGKIQIVNHTHNVPKPYMSSLDYIMSNGIDSLKSIIDKGL